MNPTIEEAMRNRRENPEKMAAQMNEHYNKEILHTLQKIEKHLNTIKSIILILLSIGGLGIVIWLVTLAVSLG